MLSLFDWIGAPGQINPGAKASIGGKIESKDSAKADRLPARHLGN